MDEHYSQVAEAFSRKALIYDEFGEDHPQFSYMRARVRRHVLTYVKPGDKMLELNAGTGGDAAYFVGQGLRVHATDIAPGMLAEIKAKIGAQGLEGKLSVQACSFTALEEVAGGPYEHVFSNMGGVNCEQDLRRITSKLPYVLAPGGVVTWVVMPPICPWELGAALKGDFRLASRRVRPGGILAHVEGVYFQTYYHTPGQVRRAFGKDFKPLKLEGLAVFTPTADRKEYPREHPRLYRALRRLDKAVCERWPFNHWGDFFILSLRYQPG